eukprot:3073903-Pyramimonas_sp.AAC.1
MWGSVVSCSVAGSRGQRVIMSRIPGHSSTPRTGVNGGLGWNTLSCSFSCPLRSCGTGGGLCHYLRVVAGGSQAPGPLPCACMAVLAFGLRLTGGGRGGR